MLNSLLVLKQVIWDSKSCYQTPNIWKGQIYIIRSIFKTLFDEVKDMQRSFTVDGIPYLFDVKYS